MAAPRKYDAEYRERAVRMYRDRLAEGQDSTRRPRGVVAGSEPGDLSSALSAYFWVSGITAIVNESSSAAAGSVGATRVVIERSRAATIVP